MTTDEIRERFEAMQRWGLDYGAIGTGPLMCQDFTGNYVEHSDVAALIEDLCREIETLTRKDGSDGGNCSS
jgi:hypothetical protein